MTYILSRSYEHATQQAHIYIGLLPSKDSKAGELASAWSLIGIAEARLGRADLAVEALRQAAKLAPSEEEAWLNLTRELMELSRFADAISATQEGIASNPESYALRLRLGAGQLAAGRHAAAEDIFRALVVAGDPLPTSYIGLAQVLLRQAFRRAGNTKSATEHADASSDTPPPAEGDLLGDFLPPQWKMPSAD